MKGTSAPPSTAGRLAGAVLLLMFLVLAGLVFLGIYLAISTPYHFWALFAIGLVSLVFAVGSYFGQALSRQPFAQRALAYGFAAFGFGLLFLTTLLFPYLYGGIISQSLEIGLLILLIIMAIVPVVGAMTGARNRASETYRQQARAQWRESAPPSAFSYAAAQPPATPPPASNGPTPPTRGA